jgi:hypothetical protein
VSVDLSPFLTTAANEDRQGMHTTAAVSRISAAVQRSQRSHAQDADNVMSPPASSSGSRDDELLPYRRVDTVPIFRKLPPRLQSLVCSTDEGCHVLTKVLLASPIARLMVFVWLSVLHVWMLIFMKGNSAEHHLILSHTP